MTNPNIPGGNTPKQPVRRGEDQFINDVITMLDGVALQISFGDFDQKLQVARVQADVILSLTAHDRDDKLLFGVQMQPVKSTRSRNEPYRVNSFKIYIADDEVNYGGGFAGDLSRDDKGEFERIKVELSCRVGELIKKINNDPSRPDSPLPASYLDEPRH